MPASGRRCRRHGGRRAAARPCRPVWPHDIPSKRMRRMEPRAMQPMSCRPLPLPQECKAMLAGHPFHHLETKKLAKGGQKPPISHLCRHGDLVVLERERTDALAGCLEISVKHRWCSHADGRLANAAPWILATRGHDDRFYLWHIGNPHRVVTVEVGLFDGPLLDGALLEEQSGEPVHK